MIRKNYILYFSVFVFLTTIIFSGLDSITLITLIPLVFGILSYIILPKIIILRPGLIVLLIVMCFRYFILPFLQTLSGYGIDFEFGNNNFVIASLLIYFEMLISLLLINFFYFRKSRAKEINITSNRNFKRFSYFLPIFFLILSTVLSVSDATSISRYNFIINNSTELIITDLSEVSSGIPRILNYTHFFLIILVFYWFFNKYKLTKNNVYFYLGTVFVTLLTCFYQDQSRNSMLLPLLAVFFMTLKYYPEFRKIISLSFSVIILLSMTLLSFMKFFYVKEFSLSVIEVGEFAQLVDSYFSGFAGILSGVENFEYIRERMTSDTILNEIFGSTIFINTHFNLENRTTNFYNDAMHSKSMILPTIVQGYLYFGFLFSWIFTGIIVYLVSFFDHLSSKTFRVDLTFLYTYTAVSLAWLYQGNFVICMSILNTVLVLLVLFKLNDLVGNKILKYLKY